VAGELKQMGRYLIERVLGKGAMGVVYLARDPVIGRLVALKTLNVPADSEEGDEFRQRFLREAQAAGLLTHPGIVTVFDAGVDDASGLSFIAMEYVEGKSLKELLKSGHMFTYSEVARVGSALAGALDYAHAKGVVHRDIKPANILITTQGAIKITDFGVARLESSNLTAEGQFIGTPNYMSPEQVAGTPVDGRSDLFSLGVVVFELLTGQRPFGGNSLTEVSYKIVHEAPPIPSHLRPALPPAFNPILLKLLEKDPTRRYQKGADVARALDALRRVLAGSVGEGGALGSGGARAVEGGRSISAAHTATRATTVEAAPAPEPAAPPSLWKQVVEPRWVALIIATAALLPGAVVAVLLALIDRGPFPGVDPAEPGRRHRVAAAQLQAEAALRAGDPDAVIEALADVWDQAPYASRARELLAAAKAAKESKQTQALRTEQARRLREEGQEALRAGRVREAQSRFEDAVSLDPNDPLTREYLDLAKERGRSPGGGRAEPLPSSLQGASAPTPVPGQARLELYFNCPLSTGSIEVEVDGARLAMKPFDFTTRGLFGLKKKGAGIIQDAYTVQAGSSRVTVRLFEENGTLRAEETLPVTFVAGSRAILKVEMAGEKDVPRFTLTTAKGRG
jgi:eukaryotic-like serine/threonine-protein kinase